MSIKPGFSIAIVGGGIGGLFAALCIHHHCNSAPVTVQIDVYEQAAKYKEIGAGIGVGVNAVRLVDELGLVDRLYALSGNPDGTTGPPAVRRFDNGDEIFRWPAPKQGRIRMAGVSRSDLLDLLLAAIEERGAARLHTGTACQGVEDAGGKVTIRFSDGTTRQANVVLACDGIHSTIRDQFVSDKPRYSGQIAYRDVIPAASLTSLQPGTLPSVWLGQHSHFLSYPMSRGEAFNVIAFLNKPDTEAHSVEESWTTTCDRADVQRDFSEHEETVQLIIRSMRDKPSRWRINDREPLDRWYYMDGKVMLLGDAAHSMVPHLGAGAGSSMEDGWVIGRALSDFLSRGQTESPHPPTLETVAALYQSARLPRAQKTQAASRMVGNTYDCQTEDLIHLTFDECCPILGERISEAMRWVWDEDLDVCYENVRKATALAPESGKM